MKITFTLSLYKNDGSNFNSVKKAKNKKSI